MFIGFTDMDHNIFCYRRKRAWSVLVPDDNLYFIYNPTTIKMEQKLIKLSETHYIVVDDSEIKEGDLGFNKKTKEFFIGGKNIEHSLTVEGVKDVLKKVTHSTQPFNFDFIEPLILSEVEEAIYGYSVEKMSLKTLLFPENLFYEMKSCSQNDYLLEEQFGLDNTTKYREILGYIKGFKAHKELVKDKLFTVEDMEKCFKNGFLANDDVFASKEFVWIKYEQSLLPKTEWDVEFDEQGKLKLI